MSPKRYNHPRQLCLDSMNEGEAMAMQRQYNDDYNKIPGKRPRLMIDISPELRRRIKIAAAQKDVSIREYVEDILEQVVPSETNVLEKRESGRLNSAAIEDLLKTREEIMRAHPGQVYDSVETLHQLREERLKELEQ
jgi:ParD-like antitoxin of type II ParDE toxin-antitoxin system